MSAGTRTGVRGVIREMSPGHWECGFTLPGRPPAVTLLRGRLADIADMVDELLEIVADEWPDIAQLEHHEIDWWARDVLDDLGSAA